MVLASIVAPHSNERQVRGKAPLPRRAIGQGRRRCACLALGNANRTPSMSRASKRRQLISQPNAAGPPHLSKDVHHEHSKSQSNRPRQNTGSRPLGLLGRGGLPQSRHARPSTSATTPTPPAPSAGSWPGSLGRERSPGRLAGRIAAARYEREGVGAAAVTTTTKPAREDRGIGWSARCAARAGFLQLGTTISRTASTGGTRSSPWAGG